MSVRGEIYMRKNNFLKITTYAAVFGLIGGMSFEGTTYISNKYLKTNGKHLQMQKHVLHYQSHPPKLHRFCNK